MKKRVTLLAILICFNFGMAQNRYINQANESYNKGDYSSAAASYEAGLAMMDSEGVEKTSVEYVEIEKRLHQAKENSSILANAMRHINLDTEEGYKEARRVLTELRRRNSRDGNAQALLNRSNYMLANIATHREDRAMWAEIKNSRDIKKLETYLETFKAPLFAEQANSIIQDVEEEQLWQRTTNDGSLDAYITYISTTKLGRYMAEAEKKRDWDEDTNEWFAIQDSEDVNDFTSYLNNKTTSSRRFSDQAEAKIQIFRAMTLANDGDYRSAFLILYDAKEIVKLSEKEEAVYMTAFEEVLYSKVKDLKEPQDVITFIDIFPESKYYDELSDMHALNLAKQFDSFNMSEEDFDEALSYAKQSETKQSIRNRYLEVKQKEKRISRRVAWDDRFNLGLGAGGELLGYNWSGVLHVNMKFGGYDDLFNITTGVGIEYMSALKSEGFTHIQLSVPFVPRLKIASLNWKTNMFIGAGGKFNALLSSKYKDEEGDKESVKDYLRSTNLSLIGQIGVVGEKWEFSLYYRHYLNNFYKGDSFELPISKNAGNQIKERGFVGFTLMYYLPL